MDNAIDQVEIIIRATAADVLFASLLPRLYQSGWHVTVNADGETRSLSAYKGTGWIYLPGGRGGRWSTRVVEVEPADTTPADRRGLLPEHGERPVWRVELDQCTPADVILSVAERAAAGPDGVLV